MVGRTLNDCFITKNENITSNIKLSKIKNIADIMELRKYVLEFGGLDKIPKS